MSFKKEILDILHNLEARITALEARYKQNKLCSDKSFEHLNRRFESLLIHLKLTSNYSIQDAYTIKSLDKKGK